MNCTEILFISKPIIITISSQLSSWAVPEDVEMIHWPELEVFTWFSQMLSQSSSEMVTLVSVSHLDLI